MTKIKISDGLIKRLIERRRAKKEYQFNFDVFKEESRMSVNKKPKEKAFDYIKTEQRWIVFHDRDGESLDSYEVSYHSFDTVEEAINIALREQALQIFDEIDKSWIIENKELNKFKQIRKRWLE